VNLIHNKIQHILLHDAKHIKKEETKRNVKILVENNPLNCDYDMYDFLRYKKGEMRVVQSYFQIELENLICHSPKKLEKVRVDDLSSWRYSKNLTYTVTNIDSVIMCSERCVLLLEAPYVQKFVKEAVHNLRS